MWWLMTCTHGHARALSHCIAAAWVSSAWYWLTYTHAHVCMYVCVCPVCWLCGSTWQGQCAPPHVRLWAHAFYADGDYVCASLLHCTLVVRRLSHPLLLLRVYLLFFSFVCFSFCCPSCCSACFHCTCTGVLHLRSSLCVLMWCTASHPTTRL